MAGRLTGIFTGEFGWEKSEYLARRIDVNICSRFCGNVEILSAQNGPRLAAPGFFVALIL